MANPTTKKNLRKEQLQLLKFEKAAMALATAGVALPGIATAAETEISEAAVDPEAIEAWRHAFLDLAVKTSEIHSAFEIKAGEVGARLIEQASGGTPKPPHMAYMEQALSILGLK